MKKILALLMAILVLLTFSGCEKINTSEINPYASYIENIVADANNIYDSAYRPLCENSNPRDYKIKVNKINDTYYKVTVSGEVLEIPLGKDSDSKKYVPSNIESYEPEAYKNVKAKMVHFIENTDFFKDKEMLIEKINTLPMYKADFTDSEFVPAYYDDDDKCIYVSKKVDKEFFENYFERMVLHEMMHALQSITHGGKENIQFVCTAFDEGMTELLTLNLTPYAYNEYVSEYQDYFLYLYGMISIFGEELIEAYFYGYDSVLEKISTVELEFFSLALSNINIDYTADLLLNTLICNWSAELKKVN